MEMIPVAITRAKYPGNRFAAARESGFCGVFSVITDSVQPLRRSACSRVRHRDALRDPLHLKSMGAWSLADRDVGVAGARTPARRANDARRLYRNLRSFASSSVADITTAGFLARDRSPPPDDGYSDDETNT